MKKNTVLSLRHDTSKQTKTRRKNMAVARKFRWSTKTDRKIDDEAHRIFWSGLTWIFALAAFIYFNYLIIPAIYTDLKHDLAQYIQYDMPRFTLADTFAMTIDAPLMTPSPQQSPIAEAHGDKNVIQKLIQNKNTPNSEIKQMGIDMVAKRFGEQHVDAYVNLITKESNFRNNATNKSSGACGIYQAYPCSKLPCQLTDVKCQHEWGMNYIANRYGNPTNAWNHWQARVRINGQDVGHWY